MHLRQREWPHTGIVHLNRPCSNASEILWEEQAPKYVSGWTSGMFSRTRERGPPKRTAAEKNLMFLEKEEKPLDHKQT